LKRIDLHTHTRYSDGTSTPRELVERARKARVELMFLTDHDTVSGFPEALEAARESGVELRCGIEINTIHADNVHILGYGFRHDDPGFLSKLAEFRERRERRIRMIVENLRKLGIDISFEEVTSTSHETLGRPHVADALRRKGVVSSRQEAFNRFLTRGKPGYVDSMGPSPDEAIALIRSMGGFCSVAHPETIGHKEDIARWKDLGLEGIEVYYGAHSPSEIVRYGELARKLGLLATGGSDYHGPGTGRDKSIGVEVPDEVFDAFMERLARCPS
jgi:predicted metal-dependent phosphoesterase TrpH